MSFSISLLIDGRAFSMVVSSWLILVRGVEGKVESTTTIQYSVFGSPNTNQQRVASSF